MNKDNGNHDLITSAALQSLLKNMTDMMFVKNSDLVYLCASQSFAKLIGAEDPQVVVGKTDAELFDDEALIRRYTDDDRRLIASGKPLKAYIEPIWSDDGNRGYCQTSKFPIHDTEGNVIGLYGISRDVTREYRAKLNYEQELRSLFELPPDALGAALIDVTNWRMVDIRIKDEKARKAFDFRTVDSFLRTIADSVVEDETAHEFYLSLSQKSFQNIFEDGKRRLNFEYRRKLVDGSIRWIRNELYFMSDPVNGNLCIMSIMLDINKEKQAVRALERAAQRDGLTDIYNRETTMVQISSFLSGEGEKGNHLLFMIDVDNFKLINDKFGHQTGDEALIQIARSIRKVFKVPDIVGRIGGDEFFVLMKNVENPSEGRKRAVELVEALQYECSEGNINVRLSGSAGISCYSGNGKTLEQLYSEADAALYKAKSLGKNRFVFADATVNVWCGKENLSTVNLRTLLENIDAAMFQTEMDGKGDIRVTYSSHSLFSDPSRMSSQSGTRDEDIWSVILPVDLEALKTAVRIAVEKGTVLDCSCRVKNPGGQIEWRHIRGTHLPDQGDDIRRMIHVATDITLQKQAEEELREKNNIIDFAMRNTDVNLWYFDYKTKECQLTQSCQKAHEMPGVEVLENFPECLIETGYVREDCVGQYRDQYRKFQMTGENIEFDVWFRKADGTGWWCERNMLSPLPNVAGEVTRGIGIGKDVTAERNLEEKYEAFGAYRRLAEKNTRASYRMNLTNGWVGDCITSNKAVRELYPEDTVDQFLERLYERMATIEDKEHFHAIMLREHLLDAFSRGECLQTIDCHFCNEEDRVIWLRITVEMMRNPVTGDVEGLLYSFDIDREKNMQFLVDKLLEDDYEFMGIIDVATGHLMIFGENPNMSDMVKNERFYDDVMKWRLGRLILDEYYEEGVRNMSQTNVMKELQTKKYYTCSFPTRELPHVRAGRKQWKFGYLDDSKSKILISRTDITSTYTVEYDSLTGLYNREAFYKHVRETLNENPEEKFLLIRFDIDRFKAYNDVYGAQAGDRLLASAGKSARSKAWSDLTVFGRLEADHIVAIIPEREFDLAEWSTGHCEWLEDVTEGYHLTSSVGIFVIKDPSVEVALMCDRALLALRTVKESYAQKVAWYDESLRESLMNEQALADDMEQALREEQFVVFFQPIIDYDNRALIGAEALVRWLHPSRGLIPPGEFIPIFEKNGFILKLDAFVWEKSCQHLRRWMNEGKKSVPISVNVSRCDLYDPQLCERFKELLNKYDLPYTLLKLEITESAYMDDPDQLISAVNQLRSVGFIVEMDDFGTGYSSLNMLKDMPVDILKLDTRFISESESDVRASTILSSIIRMARQLGLSIIAEGVETKAQAESLKELQCTNMQGYYFGRPMPVSDFEKLL